MLDYNHALPIETQSSLNLCLHCNSEFKRIRSTKKYCCDSCRVSYNRCVQNASHSSTKRRDNIEYFDRVNFALELYFKTPPEQRDEWIQNYIDNPTTKKITCNPSLLKDHNDNIAKICHHYVKRTYGINIKDYY